MALVFIFHLQFTIVLQALNKLLMERAKKLAIAHQTLPWLTDNARSIWTAHQDHSSRMVSVKRFQDQILLAQKALN